MHSCPECGMACDCDGEDLWHSWPFNLDCTHECEDEDDDLYLDDKEGDTMYELPDDTNDPTTQQPCQNEGCTVADALACYVPGGEIGDDPDAWYCPTHAPLHGFCAGCGEHHGGEEAFENNRHGLCDMCASEREWTEARDWQAILRDGEWL